MQQEEYRKESSWTPAETDNKTGAKFRRPKSDASFNVEHQRKEPLPDNVKKERKLDMGLPVEDINRARNNKGLPNKWTHANSETSISKFRLAFNPFDPKYTTFQDYNVAYNCYVIPPLDIIKLYCGAMRSMNPKDHDYFLSACWERVTAKEYRMLPVIYPHIRPTCWWREVGLAHHIYTKKQETKKESSEEDIDRLQLHVPAY